MKELVQFIDDHTVFAVVSHKEPDGDCVGSSLALRSLLERLGKRVILLSPGPFTRFEISRFEHHFHTSLPQSAAIDGAIILDCSTPERIGAIASQISHVKKAVIDHHAAGVPFGDVRCVDPRAPSVTSLIHRLFEQYKLPLTRDEARHLLFGLCTDTGFFRHLTDDSGTVFNDVASLCNAGASPHEVYRMMYGNRPLASRILLGSLLAGTRAYFDGKLLITTERQSDLRGSGTEIRDSDTLYLLLQSTAFVEAVVLIREEEDGKNSVGLRSGESIDVGAIARSLGGGGHTKAAGFSTDCTVEEIEKTIFETFSQIFR